MNRHRRKHDDDEDDDDRRVIPDGGVVRVAMPFMDAVQPSVASHGLSVHDVTGGRAGYRPGFVLDASADTREEAAAAYDERSEWMANAWRRPAHAADQDDPPSANLSDAQLRDRAAKAYDERSRWMANAWRKNK
jgi:hypothetical protein